MISHLRKRIVAVDTAVSPMLAPPAPWLDLAKLAIVEVTSEELEHPIEAALTDDTASAGWRAATPGKQTLRILFDVPQRIERVALRIDDAHAQSERTQEIALAWVSASGARTSIVRQRWNFSPNGSISEQEDYRFTPGEAAILELVIDPNVADAAAIANLTWLRVG